MRVLVRPHISPTRESGMKKFKTRLLLCAGMALASMVASAGLVDATVLVDRAANNKTLTVRYDGANAALVEMVINGQSVASKEVSADLRSGETNFTVDVAALEEGTNKVEIRLYDRNGKLVGKQTTTINIDRAGNGPVFISNLRSNDTTQGMVEIKVGFRAELKNVFVSFFVNDDFKVLKNFPPYTYRWDTTSVENGWHEVQAWVVDDSNATFKTEKVRLFVNNPGGRTKRQDIAPIKPQAKPESKPEAKPAAKPESKPAAKPEAKPAVKPESKPIAKPEAKPVKAPILPAVTKADGTKSNTNTGTAAPASKPAEPVKPNSKPKTDSVIDIKPSTPKQPEATQTKPEVIPPKTDVVALASPAKLKPIAINFGTRLNDVDQFDIYLEGQKVNFDVAPRVEDGVPLSPFRHLFEAYGGKVKWDHASKTVEGVSDDAVIWFKIGDSSAKVDGTVLLMERAAFLEKGRSVVPMSFLGQALKLDIQYDANTGHVLILSAKNK